MQILIDLRWMIPGSTGGIETQAREFLNTLLEIDYSNQYLILIPSEARFDFDLSGHKNFTLVNADGPYYYLHRLAEKIGLRRARSKGGIIGGREPHCDVAISMPGYTSADLQTLPTLLVVPDIQHEYFPEYFSKDELANRLTAFRTSISMARTICAISAFTRQTLIEKLNVPAEKIVVTPLAVDPRLTMPVSQRDQNVTLRKYGLRPGYLFYPAFTWPHKNHLNLIRALQLLRDQSGLGPELVCTGSAKEAQPEIQAIIDQSRMNKQVHLLGFVTTKELSILYRNAAGLVFPSMFEGFGLPVLEAMACGCPVLCSQVAALPEVGGDNALYFDPRDPGDIAQVIQQLLEDSTLRNNLIEKGVRHAQTFSWRRFTMQVLQQAYRSVNSSLTPELSAKLQDWRADEWGAYLFSQQPADFASGSQRNVWQKIKRAHHHLAMHWRQTSAAAARQQRPFNAIWYGLCASILSPRASFVSLIFPLLRDLVRKMRTADRV